MTSKNFLLLLVLLSGCAEKITRPEIGPDVPAGTVLVYRESSLIAGGSTLYFGEEKKVYLVLENQEFGQIKVASGSHWFEVSEYNGAHFKVPVDVKPDGMTCFRAHADSTRLTKLVIPILFAISYAFKMEPVSCSTQDLIARGYKSVP